MTGRERRTVFNGPGSKCKGANCQEYFDPERPCCRQAWTPFEENSDYYICSMTTKEVCQIPQDLSNGDTAWKGIWHEDKESCGQIDCSGPVNDKDKEQGFGTAEIKLRESLKKLKKKS